MSEATNNQNAKNINNIISADQIEETLLWNIQRIEERQKTCVPDSIEKALAGVEEALTSVQSALGKTENRRTTAQQRTEEQRTGSVLGKIAVAEEKTEEQRTESQIIVGSDIFEDLGEICDKEEICDMSPKEDLNLPAVAQNDSDPEPVEEPLVGAEVPNAEAIENEVVPVAAANTSEKVAAAASAPEPMMEIPEEIIDADLKDEDSEELSLQESIVIGTVQISDTVHIDQEVYSEKKEKAEGEPSFFEEIKESVIETTSKLADDIAKILDEPEDSGVTEADKSNVLLEAIEKESKPEESVWSDTTGIDAGAEKESVISKLKFAHDLSENRRESTFLTELDDTDENDKIVEEKVEQIVEKVVAEHSIIPSLAAEKSKEDEIVVEELLEEVQNASTISSQTEALEEISVTSQTEVVNETSSTSQTEVVEETSSTSQTEVVKETSSTSQTEVVTETSSTSQTEPVEKIEVFEKTSQTSCTELVENTSQTDQHIVKGDIESPSGKIEIIEEPIIEILQSVSETEALEENHDEKMEELARNICSNMEEPLAQMETTQEVPIGAIAIAVLAIFLALIIFYR